MTDCRNRFVYRAKADEGPLSLDPALSNASNNIRTAIHQLFDAHDNAAMVTTDPHSAEKALSLLKIFWQVRTSAPPA